jgi:hypothetical protein
LFYRLPKHLKQQGRIDISIQNQNSPGLGPAWNQTTLYNEGQVKKKAAANAKKKQKNKKVCQLKQITPTPKKTNSVSRDNEQDKVLAFLRSQVHSKPQTWKLTYTRNYQIKPCKRLYCSWKNFRTNSICAI